MIDSWHLPPARVLVGIGATVLAVGVLGVRSCTGDPGAGSGAVPSTSTSAGVAEVEDTSPTPTTTSSIVVLPDWYPKQSSRYSDRAPAVTVTTLQPTTSTSTTTVVPGGSGRLDGD